VNHLARGFEIGALAEIVAAKADGGNAQAGAAEIANLHGPILWDEARDGPHWGHDIEAEKGAGRHGLRACQAIAQGRDKKMRPRSDAATDGDRWARDL
jgi:uncharacterized protein involved in high-affinity Fe2+ transport